MKVLVVEHYFPPHIGAMEEVARNQAASLTLLGHEVTVLTSRHDRALPKREGVDPGYVVRRARALSFVESRFGVTFPLVSPWFLVTAIRAARRADVVHVHDVFYPVCHAAGLAAALTRRPLSITQHVAFVDFPNALVMSVQRLVYRLVGRRLFRRARAIVAYNPIVRSFLLGQGVDPAKILLTHNGIDVDFFSPGCPDDRAALRRRYGLPADRPLVLYVGRLVPKKGYDLVYRARSHNHYTLIAGNGYVETGMHDDDDVRFFGAASREQLRDLYRAADLFVFPAAGEIFTLVMQEAMASGLPVVVADDPGYAEYEDLDRARIALVERSVEGVREAINELVADPARRERMAAYSRELAVQRFSWDANYPAEYAAYIPATIDAQ